MQLDRKLGFIVSSTATSFAAFKATLVTTRNMRLKEDVSVYFSAYLTV